jgi:hypothetical protein
MIRQRYRPSLVQDMESFQYTNVILKDGLEVSQEIYTADRSFQFYRHQHPSVTKTG